MTEEVNNEEVPKDQEGSGSDDESEEEEVSVDDLNNGLLQACRENNIEAALGFLKNAKTNPLYEKENWTPLLWAACNGNEDLCQALIKVNAHAPYLH
jgi:ankyrin repeat protein